MISISSVDVSDDFWRLVKILFEDYKWWYQIASWVAWQTTYIKVLLTCVLEINSSEKKKIKPVLTCYLQKVFIRLIFWLWKLGLGPWMVDHFDLCMCLSAFLFILVSKSELYIIQGLILWWVFCWNSCVVGYTTGCQKWKGYCGGWSLLCAVLSFMLLNILKLWTSSCEERGQVVFHYVGISSWYNYNTT